MATKKRRELAQSETIEELPAACADEAAGVEFFERKRWGDCPCCPECGDINVYQMKDRKTGARNKDFRWRCRGCGKLYSVRTGMVFEESLVPMHKWARAIWESACCKNGISAMELSRKLQVTYRTALFMLNRLRHAMAQDYTNPPKLTGTVEADECYIGGKPRYKGNNKRGRGTLKQPVAAVLQRGGQVRTRLIPVVNSNNLRAMLLDNVDPSARIMTDKEHGYISVGREFASHETVDHGRLEYVRGDVTTNRVEGFFARVRRKLTGTHHAVSKEHLHRYLTEAAFLFNHRELNDGERVLKLIKETDGKRLRYRQESA